MALLLPLLAVVGLYVVVMLGVESPLWRSLVRGEPVGLETSLSDDERTRADLLAAAFERMNYRLDRVAAGHLVPAVFLPAVPVDLDELAQTGDKKQVFLRLVLPLILVVNQDIAQDRLRLEAMVKGRIPRDIDWLAQLAERYQSKSADPGVLLRRVDIVPPSLALAQAAEESGWGTSRFVREGNNLFGHISSGDGIVPEQDRLGPNMASFESLHAAVKAYVQNLNSHAAYESLRRVRAQLRARGATPDGDSLAGTLTAYSERGQAYVDGLRALIRHNDLLRYDRAKLAATAS